MIRIGSDIESLKKSINKATNNNSDYKFKEIRFKDYKIYIMFCISLTSSEIINNYILEFFEEQNNKKIKIKDILTYLEQSIPANNVNRTIYYNEMMYYLCSGFTIIAIDGYSELLAIETKAMLNSPIDNAKNETVIKGPNDSFSENYQSNIGLIRKRIKSEDLWIDEVVIGNYSKTKVGILYMENLASKEIVEHIKSKIEGINIDEVSDLNYVIDIITGNIKQVFPTYLSTERPDMVSAYLLDGRIAVVVENSQLVGILPILFIELFHNAEDYYQNSRNANYTRIIRFIAFFITIFTPAVYLAMTTYNHETIPTNLLINFSIQRDGVPLPSFVEALLMLLTFEILKETDARIPNIIGSSLSIVGALVLGEAAVSAGIVSPIMVIVIAITAISGFTLSYFDVPSGSRWWRLIFLMFASIVGMVGVMIALLLFIINLSGIKTLGVPYLTPIAPFNKQDLTDGIFVNKKSKFKKKSKYFVKRNK